MWLATCCSIFKLLLLTLICPIYDFRSSATSQTKNAASFFSSKSPIVLASTVDGRVSALDVQHGVLLWKVNLEKPLVASSISKLIYQQDGKSYRLIPSLNGGLFRFDGEGVEAVPFDTDQLLSSSFRLAEETVLVGGKETSTCGVDAHDGRVLYSCSSSGCQQSQNVFDGHDIIVIKRYQQTVRSIENRNGMENWNFSVGEVELDFSKGKASHLLQGSDVSRKDGPRCGEEKREGCEADKHEPFDTSGTERIKVIVPDGTVCLMDSNNKHLVAWKYQFKVPIASAWLLLEGTLHKLNLFDPTNVPALEQRPDSNKPRLHDTVYMGKYDKYVYIQSSPNVQKAISQSAESNVPGSAHERRSISPRFSYRPFIARAKQLTPANVGQGLRTDGSSSELVVRGQPPHGGSCRNELSVYESDFDNDGGYYLQSDVSYLSRIHNSKRKGRATTVNTFENESYGSYNMRYVYVSFLHRWKELIALTVSVSVVVQLLIAKYFYRHRASGRASPEPSLYDLPPQQAPSTQQALEREYESRFLQDFEPMESIGKGGFGVVIQARNKMDDCEYAVKRILLPESENAREKVLREVRALAKLDHPSIVRYFNAWSEQPPPGWQKKQDLALMKDSSTWTQTPHPASVFAPATNQRSSSKAKNALTAATGDSSEQSSTFGEASAVARLQQPPALDVTGAFDVTANAAQSCGWTTGTGSFACSGGAEGSAFQGGKFFVSGSSSGSSGPGMDCGRGDQASVPFKHYEQDSMSIVFDDGYGSKPDVRSGEFWQQGTSFKPADTPPSYEDVLAEDGLRRRSVSVKETSSSELKSVVCCKPPTDGAGDADKPGAYQRTAQRESPAGSPPRTVYLYIQMQLCRKESLREWLASNTTNRNRLQCIEIFQQVVSAVIYVHDQGLIHRDLKPSNVLFSLDGTVKVGDFGLVTDAHSVYDDVAVLDVNLATSRHTEKVGTRMYMAPEQMNSSNYSEKVDIYALGLILFELVHTFGTQMERVMHLTNARKLKFPVTFRRTSPLEAELTESMLLLDAASRPSADDVGQHVLFKALDVDGVERASGTKRTRTASSRSSDSLSSSA